jgi:hypothetical protein
MAAAGEGVAGDGVAGEGAAGEGAAPSCVGVARGASARARPRGSETGTDPDSRSSGNFPSTGPGTGWRGAAAAGGVVDAIASGAPTVVVSIGDISIGDVLVACSLG